MRMEKGGNRGDRKGKEDKEGEGMELDHWENDALVCICGMVVGVGGIKNHKKLTVHCHP